MHYVAGNRSLSANNNVDNLITNVAADKWHVDSRYNMNRRLGDGFSFVMIIALDASDKNNATRVVPGSHLNRERPNPEGNYDYATLVLDCGQAAVLDTGLWHKGGSPNENNRWGLHIFFAPWFVKPYFSYVDTNMPEFMKDYNSSDLALIRKLLHFNSWPPLNDSVRIKTVIPLER